MRCDYGYFAIFYSLLGCARTQLLPDSRSSNGWRTLLDSSIAPSWHKPDGNTLD
ncbi:hypothetical protein QT987_27365 [Microcoleus sp. SVA1B4]